MPQRRRNLFSAGVVVELEEVELSFVVKIVPFMEGHWTSLLTVAVGVGVEVGETGGDGRRVTVVAAPGLGGVSISDARGWGYLRRGRDMKRGDIRECCC